MRSRLALAALLACAPLTASAAPPIKLTLRYDEGVAEHPGRPIRAREVKISASSTLCEKNSFCHKPERLLDGKKETAWCEGAPGKGVGQTLVLDLARPRKITTIRFLPFYAKNKKSFFENAQAKELEIKTDNGTFLVAFSVEDPVTAFGGAQMDHSYPYVEFPTDPKVKHDVTTQRLEITVKAVYPGSKFEDLCMSELTLHAR